MTKTPGRRPTPTHLRLLQGNPQRRPVRDEPQPLQLLEAPPPPGFIEAYATEEWLRLAPELHRLGLMTIVDSAPFAAYCVAFARWRTAEEALAVMAAKDPVMRGLIVKGKHGTAVENPLVYTSRRAAQEMLRFAQEFGFTPAARSRIQAGVSGGQAPVSKFGDLLA
jgi:P27 family predicted phage terminase small subunit